MRSASLIAIARADVVPCGDSDLALGIAKERVISRCTNIPRLSSRFPARGFLADVREFQRDFSRSARLLSGSVVPCNLSTDVEYARYHGETAGTSRESPSNERVAILSSLVLRSLRARRVPPHEGERPGAARCSRDSRLEACSSFPRLARACASISFSLFLCLPLSLRLPLSSSVATRLQHPSPFRSRVPASRPTTNPCARITIRESV